MQERKPEKIDKVLKKELENKEYKELMELQHNVKIQPELFIKETSQAVNTFKEEYNKVKAAPASKNERFIHYCSFLAHVSDIFHKDLAFLSGFLFELLLTYGTIMNPYNRIKVVKCIILMRNKGVIQPIDALNNFFKLLTIKDKEMRSVIINHIINDIKNMNAHKKNLAVNKQVQNYIFDILKHNTDTLAKRAIFIMIELYKKQVWNDAKTVNVIASGCFNENQKVLMMACHFLIETTEVNYAAESDSEDDEAEVEISKKDTHHSKKTKAKEARKERELKRLKRRERRKSRIQLMRNFFPIDMINNPQDFCDKLFAQLKKKNFKFEATLAMMAVLGRMIGRHKLIVLNFYPFMMKYMFPHQKEIAKILAYVAESCHELTPPDELETVLKHLIDNFVNERVNDDKITMGLRTIREMSEKAPTFMDEFSLNYCAEFKNYKEKNVAAAARSLINYFRDVNPDLLSKKFRGRFDFLDKKSERKTYMYGELKINERVDGAELLQPEGDVPIEWDRILTDEDFKKIKILKRRKMEQEIERRENLNHFIKEKKEDDDDDEEGFEIEDDEDEDGEEGEEIDDGLEAEEGDEDYVNVPDLSSDEEGEELEFIDGEEEDDEEGEEEDDDDDEEGEEDGEEGEGEEGKKEGAEKEEGKEGEGASKKPKSKKEKKDKKKDKKASSKSELESEDEGDDNEIEDWQLEEFEDSDEDNPHGFVSADAIARFRLRKAARKELERERRKNEPKQRWYTGPKPKKGSKTNEEKQKNKPLLMLRPKKNKEKHALENITRKIKKIKTQLGHVRSRKDYKRKLIKRQRKMK